MAALLRIDRAYCNVAMREAASWFRSVAAQGEVDADRRPSDHLPLIVSIFR